MTAEQKLVSILISLSPGKRLKYIRQKILKKNQFFFCEDGIVRTGTLKSFETERMKIGEKIAKRIIHKLSLEGVQCDVSMFLQEKDPCHITINTIKKELIGSSMKRLEEIRKKTTTLTPVEITHHDFLPTLQKGNTLLTYELNLEDLNKLNHTLCLIQGSHLSLYFLTYLSHDQIIAEIHGEKKILNKTLLDFCTIYVVEIVYFGKEP